MQGTWIQPLGWEDPTCHRATKSVHHDCWASELQPLKPERLEPVLRNKESHHTLQQECLSLLQLKKAWGQQWRLSTDKNMYVIKKLKKGMKVLIMLCLPPSKWLSEEALQITEKGKKEKDKGEKERYTHLNAEFQRIARRDKKAFHWDQCKEIKENNRTGRLEISWRKLEIPREHFMQRWTQ